MPWNLTLNPLRTVLADLYPTEDDARRVADEAGVPVAQVTFDGKAANFWHDILAEALRLDRVKALIGVAQGEYGDGAALREAVAAYDPNAPLSEPTDITAPTGREGGCAGVLGRFQFQFHVWYRQLPNAAKAAAIAGTILIAGLLVQEWARVNLPGPQPAIVVAKTPIAGVAPPELKIVSVKNGERVGPRLESVNGTYARVPDDRQIWLLVEANNLCYPQEKAADQRRGGVWWHGPVYFPGSGEQSLKVALVTAEAVVELGSAAGVGRPPTRCDLPGVEIMDAVTVVVSSSP